MTALKILSTLFTWHEQCTRFDYMIRGLAAAEREWQPRQAARPVIAAVLLKIAKHIALVACLLLIGKSRGEPIVGPVATLFIIITAALIHFLGRRLQIGPAPRDRFLRGGG
jgi:hypothetical protein